MSDENAAPSPAEAEVTAETPVEEVSTTPAEAENTVTETPEPAVEEEKGPIPYGRFAEVVERRQSAEAENVTLKERLEVLERGQAAPATPEVQLEEPPENLSQREKVRWYVRRDAKEMIKESLGMDLPEAAALLSTIPTVSQDVAARKWESACSEHGLDPEDKLVQDITRGLVKRGGRELGEALATVKAFYGGKGAAATPDPPPTPQRMENGTTTGNDVSERSALVFNRKDAVKMAQRGERSPDASVDDILDAIQKRTAG